jgi:hypothetical protein
MRLVLPKVSEAAYTKYSKGEYFFEGARSIAKCVFTLKEYRVKHSLSL